MAKYSRHFPTKQTKCKAIYAHDSLLGTVRLKRPNCHQKTCATTNAENSASVTTANLPRLPQK